MSTAKFAAHRRGKLRKMLVHYVALPDCKHPLKLITLESLQHTEVSEGAAHRKHMGRKALSYVIQQRVTHVSENLKIMLASRVSGRPVGR